VEKLPQRKLSRGKAKALRPGFYNRDELLAGAKLQTPCIVAEYSATTLIDADSKARIDGFGNILITV
jgi:N-methylhydantoinase A/oxoprolinase/acetone carboxylase beta subunit